MYVAVRKPFSVGLVSLCAVVGALAFASAPALAAITPTVTIKPVGTVTATTAQVSGTVNPSGSLTTTSWEFQYSKNPETEGWASGAPGAAGTVIGSEGVSGTLEGLQPNASYQVRLLARNEEEGGEGVSAEPNPPFKTLAAPPAIESESVSNVTSSEVTFEGMVNPNNQFTECHFQYGSSSIDESTIPCTPEVLKGFGGQSVGPRKGVVVEEEEEEQVPVPTGVSEGTVYHYQIVTKYGNGEEAKGPVQSFQTFEAPEEQPAVEVSKTAWKLHGVLDPNNARSEEPGSYQFVYRQSSSECRYALSPGELEKLKAEREAARSLGDKAKLKEKEAELQSDGVREAENKYTTQEAASGAKGQIVEGKIPGLLPGTAYTVCLLVSNGAGGPAAISNQETFTTVPAPPMIVGESVSTVEANVATLEAEIVPEGAATTTHFEYLTQAQFEADGNMFGEGTVKTAESESIGSDDATHPATPVRITGLTASTTYRYRVVATNVCEPGKQCVALGKGEESFTTPAALGSTPAQNCANEQRRAEQPFGLGLPDCRAYEMVSPVESKGLDATEPHYAKFARAAVEGAPEDPTSVVPQQDEGGAVTYDTAGAFGQPTGATSENQYLSRRNPAEGGWETRAITPLHEPSRTESDGSYSQSLFNTDLTEGIANTNAALSGTSAPKKGAASGELSLYAAAFPSTANPVAYRYITTELAAIPLGASTEALGHVVFGHLGVVSEWFDGMTLPVSVNNNEGEDGRGEDMDAAGVAGWHTVSADGSRVYFASEGQLYERVNAEQPQSHTVTREASGDGTLKEDSDEVTSLTLAAGEAAGYFPEGSTEIEVHETRGRFLVEQVITGAAIAEGTKITKISPGHNGETLTLSKATTGSIERPETSQPDPTQISSEGPEPFEVGQKITGNGIPPGTTITKADEVGKLTLSKLAASSGSGEALYAGGDCTVSADACTVIVSAPQRLQENPAGTEEAKYWGASVDGSRVFFTSEAELTENAETGTGAPNLYEYDLTKPEGERLTDLTVPIEAEQADDPEGADVQGVAQISEDGSYVYFVAGGVLASGAKPETCESPNANGEGGTPCNLYVIHDSGSPTFIAALGADDREVWNGGPETNTAVVSPSGSDLAFLSREGLTGYDNEQAKPGDCEGETGVANEGETGKCLEAYLYDSGSDSHPPTLVCASCDPTGARPLGPANLGEPREGSGYSEGLYRPRVLTEDGTLFFGSYDALAPHAGDNRQNVYEYENGSIYSISNVSGGEESFLLDSSASGGDVYFATADKLLPQDPGGDIVVYDARIDGGFPVLPAAPSCDSGDSCKPPESAQPGVFAPTGSATFNGLGNRSAPTTTAVTPKKKTAAELRAEKLAKALKQCRKEKSKQKRAACEKGSRKKYGAVKAKKKKATKSANTDRRTQS